MRAGRAAVWTLLGCAALVHGVMAEPPPSGKLPDDARPLAYALNLKLDPRAERFSGQVRIKVRLNRSLEHLWLHASGIDVASVALTDARGKTHTAQLAVRNASGVAEVSFDGMLAAQDIELTIDYSAPFNGKLQGLYKVKVGNDAYAVTQMEATSARYAFPCFDEPRFKTPFDVTLSVPKDEVVIANTRPTGQQEAEAGEWKTVTFARTKPLPTYLIALAVGPWDVVEGPPLAANSVRRQALALRGIGARGNGPQLKWILDQTPAIVKYYEDYTQQPYAFDKLDLLGAPDFAAGAMENAGLIVFRDSLLRIDANSPAATYRQSFDVTAHEVAHQWFGDLVTVPWWDDIWLNEAFATWAQGKATVDLKPEFGGDVSSLEGTLHAMASDSLLSARRIRQPILNDGDITTAFDGITYQKGAAVLRMFEEWLGKDNYRAAMRQYLASHAFGSGSSDDLIATIAKVSGKGEVLKAAMRSFLDQPGLPLVHTSLSCRQGKATLALSQSRYLPYGVISGEHTQWTLPVCVRLLRAGGSSRQCFLLDKPAREFALDGDCPQSYLPNAEASGYYRFAMPEAEFAALRTSLATLTPPEQMMYADAISSAFMQGALAPDALLDAVPALAGSATPQVATALLDHFAWIRDYLANDTDRTALDAYAVQLFGARLAELGLRRRPGDSDQTTQLRARLAAFLALTAHDSAVRQALNQQGRLGLGLDGGRVDLARIDPDLFATVLKVTVQDSGESAFKAVMGELATNHQTRQRYDLLGALGSTHDPALGEQARNYGLTPQAGVGELRFIYQGNAGELENTAAFWQWLQTHFDTLAARFPDQYQSSIIRWAAGRRCSKPESEQLRAWVTPRLKNLIGGERTLAQSLEGVDQCAALREHLGDQALAAWAGAHARP
jgi:cytosol alanyl aminopeptidase